MAFSVLTLEYAGNQKSLPWWGYSKPVLRLTSQAASTLTVEKTGEDPAVAVEDIPHWGVVKVRLSTVATPLAGSDIAGWSGGLVIFVGRRTDFDRSADATRQSTTREFSDPWYDLEQVVYQHTWQIRAAGAGANTTQYYSRLNLFQDISAGPFGTWTYLSTAAQIAAIVNYAAGQSPAANLQVGVVDPSFNVPVYQVKAVTCAEALRICLQPAPDCSTFFDYTTSPPTLHFRQRGTLGSVSLPYAGTDLQGRRHKSSRFKPRYDLVPDKVVVDFQVTNTDDGVSYTNIDSYAYPPGPERGMGVQVCPIDVTGAVKTHVSGSVTAEAVDPTTTAFWTHPRRKQDLGGPDITPTGVAGTLLVDQTINGGANPQGITVVDKDKNPVSLTDFPNEITSAGVQPWMVDGSGNPIKVVEATFEAHLSYDKTDNRGTAAQKLNVIPDHVVTYHAKLTNSGVGQVQYSALTGDDPGEAIIPGLAQSIYQTLATLQWEGEHVVEEELVSAIVGPGVNFNATGGLAAWATMNAQVYDTEVDFTAGRTTVRFGPHKYLSAAQFFEYLMMWRTRIIFTNPGQRNTGQSGSDSSVVVAGDHPAPNTAHGPPTNSLVGTLGTPDGSNNQVAVYHDVSTATPANGELFIGTMLAAGGLSSSAPTCKIKLADINAAESGNPHLAVRQVGGGGVLCTPGFTGGGTVNWKGDYSNVTTYNPGDLVRMTTGTTPGIYIQKTNTTCSGQDPFFNAVSPSAYWVLFAFTPYDFTVCVGGASKTTHMNATPPA